MSQGRALKIPDREKPASRIPCETDRKRLNQENDENKAESGWERSKRETLERKEAQILVVRTGRCPR